MRFARSFLFFSGISVVEQKRRQADFRKDDKGDHKGKAEGLSRIVVFKRDDPFGPYPGCGDINRNANYAGRFQKKHGRVIGSGRSR